MKIARPIISSWATREVYGIDISLAHDNPIEYEFSQFLNNLDQIFFNPKNFSLEECNRSWSMPSGLAI